MAAAGPRGLWAPAYGRLRRAPLPGPVVRDEHRRMTSTQDCTMPHRTSAAMRLAASAAFAAVAAFTTALPVGAQTAGSTTLGNAEVKAYATGWSVKKQIIGATIYNEQDGKVGKVEDVIVAPDGTLSYAIIGAGGFVGLGRHDVAVPVSELRLNGERMVLPGATKDAIKQLPEFKYADKSERKM